MGLGLPHLLLHWLKPSAAAATPAPVPPDGPGDSARGPLGPREALCDARGAGLGY